MSGGSLAVAGNMTMSEARALLAMGVAALSNDDPVFDLSGVVEVDSSGLAVLFGWQRAAAARGKSIHVANPPASLVSLAEVYGVTDLLPLSA
jgi:phospholipid transport system transporter-binding protein